MWPVTSICVYVFAEKPTKTDVSPSKSAAYSNLNYCCLTLNSTWHFITCVCLLLCLCAQSCASCLTVIGWETEWSSGFRRRSDPTTWPRTRRRLMRFCKRTLRSQLFSHFLSDHLTTNHKMNTCKCCENKEDCVCGFSDVRRRGFRTRLQRVPELSET